MLLTNDVDNTPAVPGLFDGQEIVELWRISTEARRTADELAVPLQGLMMGIHPLLGDLGGGITASRSAPPCRPCSTNCAR